MDDKPILIRDEEEATPFPNDGSKLNLYDSYPCTICPYPVDILKIDDKLNTVTFKCLNPKEKNNLKTIPISEYLNSMKNYTYLYNKCSLCNKNHIKFKDNSIFSYCIKCDKIICSDCIPKHLETNKKNHPTLDTEYIIKNNEKSIKCLLHPKEKNIAFCLKCNIHICKECMKSKKHINHSKINIIEVSITDEVENMLNDIINIYKERIIQFKKEKEKNEKVLFDEKIVNKEKKEKEKNEKIKEIQKELKKELEKNKKLLNDCLNKLKLEYENNVKLCKNNFNISNDNISKKYERLNIYYIKKFNEELYNIEIEYNNKISNLECNKKINFNKNLLLINQLLKNSQKNYPDNYYNSNNINNIIFKYYETEDKIIKKILNKDVYSKLFNQKREEQKYKKIIKEIETFKNKINVNNKHNESNNINNDKINEVIMIYEIDKESNDIKILGEKFVKNNKKNVNYL